MAEIFLSYKSEDRSVAEAFATGLCAEGFTVWWDPVLRTGDTYDEVIERNLLEARIVVVLWSKRSVKSKWVRAEATIGERKGALLPAQIEDCDRPLAFELVHTADLRDWRGDASDRRWKAFVEDAKSYLQDANDHLLKNAAPDADTIEALFWASIKDGSDVADFEAYLARYPNGKFAGLAKNKLASDAERTAKLEAQVQANNAADALARANEELRIAEDEAARRIAERFAAGTHSPGNTRARIGGDLLWSDTGPRWGTIGTVAIALLLLAGIASVSLGGRGQIRPNVQEAVALLECTGGLAEQATHRDPAEIDGLQFMDLAVERDFANAVPILIVSGAVSNEADGERFVPPVRVTLRDSDARVICVATETESVRQLAGHSTRSFSMRIRDIPAFAKDAEVTFVGFASADGADVPAEAQVPVSSGSYRWLVASYLTALQQIEDGQTQAGIASMRDVAARGFPMAQYHLAKLYERGEGVPQDLALARSWTERAALGGNRRAMHDLGVYLSRGEGGASDEAAAFFWFSRAAQLGFTDSQYNLGILYQQGRGTAVSNEDALFWFLIAARQGDQGAPARARSIEAELQQIEIERVRGRVNGFQMIASDPIANGLFDE